MAASKAKDVGIQGATKGGGRGFMLGNQLASLLSEAALFSTGVNH